jgi:YfiH family protein
MSVPYQNSLNYGRFEVHTKKPEVDFLQAKQVHGAKIASLSELPCDADGIIVPWNDLVKPIAIKTADCLPIVIEGENGVVCLHAGWRGLHLGILRQKQIESVKPLRAFIGPSIHVCCFEVTSEFKHHFPGNKNVQEREGKLFFDLQQEARDQLRECFPNLLVEVSPICTCCNSHLHSYRRDKPLIERNWNLYIKG